MLFNETDHRANGKLLDDEWYLEKSFFILREQSTSACFVRKPTQQLQKKS